MSSKLRDRSMKFYDIPQNSLMGPNHNVVACGLKALEIIRKRYGASIPVVDSVVDFKVYSKVDSKSKQGIERKNESTCG